MDALTVLVLHHLHGEGNEADHLHLCLVCCPDHRVGLDQVPFLQTQLSHQVVPEHNNDAPVSAMPADVSS